MNSITQFLSQDLVNAIGWTIVHSIWQASLIAIATGILLWILHSKSSQIRYKVTATAMVMILIAALVTFIYVYQGQSNATVAAMLPADTVVPDAALAEGQQFVLNTNTSTPLIGFWENLTNYFNQNLPMIVVGWMMGVVLFSLRLIGGLAYAHRLKHYRTCQVTSEWQQRLEALATKAGVRKSVSLLESALVKVPVVIGHVKPVILVPLGALTGLPSDQIEIILAHELAHISRNDYLFNICQKVIDLVFFYHPAIWWLSSTVRTERENCCDDVAIAISGDSLTFAKALAGLQEFSPSTPEMAMAFTGKKNQLLNRVNRLLKGKRPDFSFSEGFVAACIIMISMVVVNLNANAEYQYDNDEVASAEFFDDRSANKHVNLNFPVEENFPDEEDPMAAIAPFAEEDEAPVKAVPSEPDTTVTNQIIVSEDGKNVFRYKKENGKIVEMSVNGEDVPEEDFDEYTEILRDYHFEAMEPPIAAVFPPGVDAIDVAPMVSGAIGIANSVVTNVVPQVLTHVGSALAAPNAIAVGGNGYTPLQERFKNVSGTFSIKYDEEERKYKDITITTNQGEITELVVNGEKVSGVAIDAVVADIDKEGRKFEGGSHFSMNFNGVDWDSDEDFSFEFALPDEEELEAAMDMSMEEFERAMEQKEEMLQRLQEQQQEMQEKLQDRQREMQEKLQDRQREMQERLSERQEEMHNKMQEMHDRQQDRDHEMNDIIVDEMLRDNLIENRTNYKLEITNKRLEVNGKKQSDELHEKYMNLFEDLKGIHFNDGTKFSFENNGK